MFMKVNENRNPPTETVISLCSNCLFLPPRREEEESLAFLKRLSLLRGTIVKKVSLSLVGAALIFFTGYTFASPKAPVIKSPSNYQTFQNQHQITVTTSKMQHLTDQGYKVQVLMDGKVKCTVKKDSCIIQPVYRGTHKLHVEVRDHNGRFVSNSKGVTIYVHLPSKLRGR